MRRTSREAPYTPPMAEPRPTPHAFARYADRLVEAKLEHLRLIRALDATDTALDGELTDAMRRLARHDDLLTSALALLERSGRNEDFDAGTAFDEILETLDVVHDDVLDAVGEEHAERVVDAMDDVEVSEDEVWREVDAVLDAAPAARAPAPRAKDPCPCGSGKTYAACCRGKPVAPTTPAETRAIHDADRSLVERVLQFAEREHGDAFDRALDRFASIADAPAALALRDTFLLWHTNVGGALLIDTWLAAQEGRLDADDHAWIAANRRAGLSIWAIEAVDRRRSLRMRDLLTGAERTVIERGVSTDARPGWAVCGRVVDYRGASLLVGMHGNPMDLAEAEAVAAALTRAILGDGAGPGARVGADALAGRGSRLVLERWCEAVERRASVPPRMTTTEGDELAWTTDVYGLEPARRDDVVRAIKALPGLVEDPGDPELPAGSVAFSKLVARAGDSSAPASSHGRIVVEPARVVVEAMSVRRADALRADLEAACGTALAHRSRECLDGATLLARARERGRRGRVEPDVPQGP